jgi:small-conductance mechanosensitive channel
MLKDMFDNPVFSSLIKIIVLFVAGKIILKVLEKIIKKFFEEKEKNQTFYSSKIETISKAIYSVVRFIIFFIIIVIILDMLGINTRSIIATAGVGGIAIAFGAQTIIQDFIKGMFLILDDMLMVGDYVDCAGISGTVESVGLRLTKIRDYDGSLHVIPNSQIQNIKNYNRGPQKAEVYFTLSYDVSLKEAKDIADRVAEKILIDQECKDLFVEKPRFFEINDMTDLSYKVRITSTVKADSQYLVRRRLRELLKEEFERRNIKSSVLEKNEEV